MSYAAVNATVATVDATSLQHPGGLYCTVRQAATGGILHVPAVNAGMRRYHLSSSLMPNRASSLRIGRQPQLPERAPAHAALRLAVDARNVTSDRNTPLGPANTSINQK